MLRRILAVLLLVFTAVSCTRDPEVVKRKYLQNGNRYFERGKYKEAYFMYRNALKKDHRYSEAYYRVGLTELRLGRPIEALRDFRRAADTDPNFTNADARVQAANILLIGYVVSQSHPESLRDEIRAMSAELLKHDPKSVAGLRLKGYLLLLADKDPKGAIEQFQLANGISPSLPEIVLPLVQSLLADGQQAEAERLGRALLEKRKDFAPMYDVLYAEYMRQNRLRDADQILQAKVANIPKEPGFWIELAMHYYRTHRPAEMEGALRKLTSNPAEFPQGRRLVGRFYAIIRDYDSAIREFQAGIQADAKRKTEYQREIAQVLIAQDRKQEAATALDEVLRADPKDDRARAMRASLMLETGDPTQIQAAITDLQSAVSRDPKNPVLRFNLGRALLAKGQLDQARLQFQEAIKNRAEYLQPRMWLAQLYLFRRDFANALRATKEILELDPRNVPAKLIRTQALAAMGDMIQARAELAQIIVQYPNSVEATSQLAILDLSEKRYREAEEAFLRLHKAHPSDLRALMGLAETYAAQNQWDQAVRVLEEELARSPGRLELRSALGNVAYRAGRYDVAIREFQALIRARPDAGGLYLRLGETYRRKGDFQAAVRTFEKAKQLRPNDPAAYLQIALMMEATHDRAGARAIYEQILKLQPDHPIALNNLAYIIAETGGDLDQALSLAQRARQKQPDDPDIADTLGWIYIKKNLSDNAVDIFRNLVAKLPQVSTYHYHLAMAFYQRGDKPQARRELLTALQQKPSAEEAARIRELLGKTG
ncbi:MAG: tetratricopeptide repeat protein [Bryobacteraceae bacterium]|jgi:tetratricopeptide (TPR) repeat protein